MVQYIKKIFTSEHAGALKPSTEFFDYCISEIVVKEKEDMIMIGDSLTADILGAVNYGIKSCWFNYDLIEHIAQSDYTIRHLNEIRKIL